MCCAASFWSKTVDINGVEKRRETFQQSLFKRLSHPSRSELGHGAWHSLRTWPNCIAVWTVWTALFMSCEFPVPPPFPPSPALPQHYSNNIFSVLEFRDAHARRAPASHVHNTQPPAQPPRASDTMPCWPCFPALCHWCENIPTALQYRSHGE